MSGQGMMTKLISAFVFPIYLVQRLYGNEWNDPTDADKLL